MTEHIKPALAVCIALCLCAVPLFAYAQDISEQNEDNGYRRILEHNKEVEKELKALEEMMQERALVLGKYQPAKARKLSDLWYRHRETFSTRDMKVIRKAFRGQCLMPEYLKTGEAARKLVNLLNPLTGESATTGREQAEVGQFFEELTVLERNQALFIDMIKEKMLRDMVPAQGMLGKRTRTLVDGVLGSRFKGEHHVEAAVLLEKAGRAMKRTESRVVEEDPRANRSAADAYHLLRDARRKLARRWWELEKKLLFERLEQVRWRLQGMLAEQLETHRLASELASGKTAAGLSRYDRVRIRKAEKNEKVIAYEARHVAESVGNIHAGILPDLLKYLALDVDELVNLLQAEDTGDYTSCVSDGIGAWLECTHEQIVERSLSVIRIEQRAFSISPQPFLTTVAELKMLRQLQVSVNKATETANTMKLATVAPDTVDRRIMVWLAGRQARLAELATKLNELLEK